MFEASERDYEVIVAADATSGATVDRLDDLRRIGVAAQTVEGLVSEVLT